LGSAFFSSAALGAVTLGSTFFSVSFFSVDFLSSLGLVLESSEEVVLAAGTFFSVTGAVVVVFADFFSSSAGFLSAAIGFSTFLDSSGFLGSGFLSPVGFA
jgi:hypothetical protein